MVLHTDFWNSLNHRLEILRKQDDRTTQPFDVFRNINEITDENFIDTLPDEIMLLIFSWLDSQSACQCRLVSRNWKVLATDDQLWRLYLSSERTLRKKSSLYECFADREISGIFASAAFNYSINNIKIESDLLKNLHDNKKFYRDVSVVSVNFPREISDAAIAKTLIPETEYLNDLQILQFRPHRRKYNPKTLYLMFRQIGKHCPNFRSLIPHDANIDGNCLKLIDKHINKKVYSASDSMAPKWTKLKAPEIELF